MIRLIITTIVCLIFLSVWNIPEGYWLLLSALILIQLRIENSFVKNQLYVLGVGTFIAANVFVANALSSYTFLLAVFLSITTFFCIYLGLKQRRFLPPVLMINLLGIIVSALDSSVTKEIQRSEAIIIGILLVVVLRSVLWPITFKNEFRRLTSVFWNSIQAMQDKIFQIYLLRDYSDNLYVYEKELHEKRVDNLDAINKMRELVSRMPAKKRLPYIKDIQHFEYIADMTITLGSLRYRVKDFSTLEVCEKEFKMISETITKDIAKIQKNERIKFNKTLIDSFENLYQTTLQVITHEPQVFLIFIHNIKKLLKEYERFSQKGHV